MEVHARRAEYVLYSEHRGIVAESYEPARCGIQVTGMLILLHFDSCGVVVHTHAGVLQLIIAVCMQRQGKRIVEGDEGIHVP